MTNMIALVPAGPVRPPLKPTALSFSRIELWAPRRCFICGSDFVCSHREAELLVVHGTSTGEVSNA